MVVLRKQVRVMPGQQKLFDDSPYFFDITNLPATVSPWQVVAEANARCDQENIIAQGKEMGALSVPLNDLMSNWAYMVMALLAWNLKCWLSLSIKEVGNGAARAACCAEKRKLLGAGLQHIPSESDRNSSPDPESRSPIDRLPADLDTVAGDSVPSSGERASTTAGMTQKSSEAEVRTLRYRHHRPATKPAPPPAPSLDKIPPLRKNPPPKTSQTTLV